MAVVLLVYVVLELAAVIAVSWAIGFGWMLLALLAGAVLGSWLARREGRRAFAALSSATKAGGSGHEELTDGVLIAVGGFAIMLPGFISDLAGFAFLLPPTRSVIRRYWVSRLERGVPGLRRTRMRGTGTVVDGEVVDSEGVEEPVRPGKARRADRDEDDRPAGGGRIIELPPQPEPSQPEPPQP